MPTQTSCPACGRALRVPDNLLGQRVRCPQCEGEFTAEVKVEPQADETAAAVRDEFPPHPQREDRPAREPLPRRPILEDDDEDDDDLDSRPRRRHYASHRGGAILTLGIVSLVTVLIACPLCGFIGIAPWLMAQNDLRAMREGRMDPSGQGSTRAGFILGIIAVGLAVLSVIAIGAFVAFAALS